MSNNLILSMIFIYQGWKYTLSAMASSKQTHIGFYTTYQSSNTIHQSGQHHWSLINCICIGIYHITEQIKWSPPLIDSLMPKGRVETHELFMRKLLIGYIIKAGLLLLVVFVQALTIMVKLCANHSELHHQIEHYSITKEDYTLWHALKAKAIVYVLVDLEWISINLSKSAAFLLQTSENNCQTSVRIAIKKAN